MISGKYLGEIVRLALKALISNGALFGGKSSTKFDIFEAFGTKYLSIIEGGYDNSIMIITTFNSVGYSNLALSVEVDH